MYKRGFTIVELIVVITVAIILMGITGFAAIQVQKDARDKKREADITLLQNELEKFYSQNGVYPPGCTTACTSSYITGNTSTGGTKLTDTTTIATIKTILPGIQNTFSDPKNTTPTTPFAGAATYTGGASERYYYFGGTYNAGTGSSATSNIAPAVDGGGCTLRSALNATADANRVGSYVVGYYSEVEKAWILKKGANGVAFTLSSGTTANCKLS